MKKNNGFSLVATLIIVTITSILSALTTGVIIYNNNRVSNSLTYADLSKDKDLSEFLEVYAQISSEYYEDVDKGKMLDKAIAAMMNYLGDDYTNYLNNDSTADLMNELTGKYNGIGVYINKETKAITEVFADSPASKAGVMVGDIIIGVNDTDTTNMETSEIVALIKKNNSDFTLKLNRNGNIINVTLKNKEIITPCISYKVIEGTSIGYLKIDTFSATLETQVSSALEELEAKGISGLIIDVRNNTGGYLNSAVDVISKFTEKGKTIYSLKVKDKVEEFKDETKEHRNYKVAILTNEETASASEILAAALKQSYGAVIVGTQTFGKGKVQQTMKLDDGSMVKYTSAYWLMPDGTCIDQVGIKPDYVVLNNGETEENSNIIKDKQLEKAIEVLK